MSPAAPAVPAVEMAAMLGAFGALVEQQFFGHELVMSLAFSPDGEWLFCGTREAVHVYRWPEFLRDYPLIPIPWRTAEIRPVLTDHGGRFAPVYALCFDALNQRLLFAGMDGAVYFLDLPDGTPGILLEPPDPLPILALDLTENYGALVVRCRQRFFERDPRLQGMPRLEVWNYPALCRRAGLAYREA